MYFRPAPIFFIISILHVNGYQDYSDVYYPYSLENELYQPSQTTAIQEHYGYESKKKKHPNKGITRKQAALGITPSQAALIGLVLKSDITSNQRADEESPKVSL